MQRAYFTRVKQLHLSAEKVKKKKLKKEKLRQSSGTCVLINLMRECPCLKEGPVVGWQGRGTRNCSL